VSIPSPSDFLKWYYLERCILHLFCYFLHFPDFSIVSTFHVTNTNLSLYSFWHASGHRRQNICPAFLCWEFLAGVTLRREGLASHTTFYQEDWGLYQVCFHRLVAFTTALDSHLAHFLSGFTPLAFEVSLLRRQQFPFHPGENGCPFRHICRNVGLLLRHLYRWGLCRDPGKGSLQGSTSRSQLGQGVSERCYSSITPQFVLACDRQSLASQHWAQVGRVSCTD
jgi:hypothetical protein